MNIIEAAKKEARAVVRVMRSDRCTMEEAINKRKDAHRAVSSFEARYNSELYEESPMAAGGRVSDDNPPNGPYKNTYGDKWAGPASSAAPQYRDPSPKAQEAVKTFRRSYRRDDD